MMVEGKRKILSTPKDSKVNWVCGDAMYLPFSRNSFDVYTISFGIRNVTNISKALSEAYRVLKPGGRLMILEFSSVNNDIISWFYEKYSFKIIPKLGEFIENDKTVCILDTGLPISKSLLAFSLSLKHALSLELLVF